MKKFINKTEDITKELLEGYVLAYQDRVKSVSYTHLTLPTICSV